MTYEYVILTIPRPAKKLSLKEEIEIEDYLFNLFEVAEYDEDGCEPQMEIEYGELEE